MSLACFLTKEQASDLAETRRRMVEDYGPASHAGVTYNLLRTFTAA